MEKPGPRFCSHTSKIAETLLPVIQADWKTYPQQVQHRQRNRKRVELTLVLKPNWRLGGSGSRRRGDLDVNSNNKAAYVYRPEKRSSRSTTLYPVYPLSVREWPVMITVLDDLGDQHCRRKRLSMLAASATNLHSALELRQASQRRPADSHSHPSARAKTSTFFAGFMTAARARSTFAYSSTSAESDRSSLAVLGPE